MRLCIHSRSLVSRILTRVNNILILAIKLHLPTWFSSLQFVYLPSSLRRAIALWLTPQKIQYKIQMRFFLVRNLITFRCVPIVVLNALLLLSTVEKTGNLGKKTESFLMYSQYRNYSVSFSTTTLSQNTIHSRLYLLAALHPCFFFSLQLPNTLWPTAILLQVLVYSKTVFSVYSPAFRIFLDHGGVGSDRISDDSSKEAVSDSHPDTLTDPEFSDPPIVTSSPPQSGDEIRREKVLTENISFSACFLNKSCSHSSNETRSCLQQQQTGKKEAFVNV